MKMPQVNDILYSKDGRSCGNLLCVHTEQVTIDTVFEEPIAKTKIWLISDYGNLIKVFPEELSLKQFYYKYGKASPTHKYYNYAIKYPEKFI